MASTSSTLPATRAFLTSLISSLPSTAQESSNPLRDLKGKKKNLLLTLHVLFPNELLPALDLLDRGLVTRLVTRHAQESEEQDRDAPGKLGTPERVRGMSENAGGEEDDDVTMEEALSIAQDEHIKAGASSEPILVAVTQPSQASVYYVRSAQQRSSRFGGSSRYYDPTAMSYEVRLKAWNCSCPAFAFSAFPSTLDASENGDQAKRGGSIGDAQVAAGTEGTGAEHPEGAEERHWSWGGCSRGEGSVGVCKHLLACILVEHCEMFAGFLEEKVVSVEEAAGWAAGWGG